VKQFLEQQMTDAVQEEFLQEVWSCTSAMGMRPCHVVTLSDLRCCVSRVLCDQVRIMKDLRHPNIVQFMGATWKPRGIVMQYMHRGSLFRLLHRNNKVQPCRESAQPKQSFTPAQCPQRWTELTASELHRASGFTCTDDYVWRWM
jgi:hypothetical protein